MFTIVVFITNTPMHEKSVNVFYNTILIKVGITKSNNTFICSSPAGGMLFGVSGILLLLLLLG